jgi:hypothetical protein
MSFKNYGYTHAASGSALAEPINADCFPVSTQKHFVLTCNFLRQCHGQVQFCSWEQIVI